MKLTNDGKLQIFFIGVGSAFALKNNQTNFLIIKGDKHIMVDFGMTGPRAFTQVTELNPVEIQCILPTHSHADHVGGLEYLALMNRYVGMRFMNKPKLKMIIPDGYQQILWDQTLRGGLEWNEKDQNSGQKLSFSDFFDVIRPTWKAHSPREIFEIDYGDIHLEIFRTKHIPEQSEGWETSFVSFGIMIDNCIFVSGDTRFDRTLIEQYSHAKLMFHDVQFFPGAVHAPLDDLKTLPKDIREKMFLIHYADNYEEKIEEVKQAKFRFAKQGIFYNSASV